MHVTPREPGKLLISLQHHADAPEAEIGGEALGDLHGQLLLRLQPGREVIDQAGEFGQPEDALPAQVADERDAGEGQHVMLARVRNGIARASSSSSLGGGEPERTGGEQYRVGSATWATWAGLARRSSPSRLRAGRAAVRSALSMIGWCLMVLRSCHVCGCGDGDAAVLGFRIENWRRGPIDDGDVSVG